MEYVNVFENQNTTHGVDGWYLDQMDWYQEDGMACFQYERVIPGVGMELSIVWRPQPTTFKHEGWWGRDKVQSVLSLTDRDRIRLERGIDLYPDEEYIDA